MTSDSPRREVTKSGRSPALMAIVVVAIVAIVAGGAFVVYKLTNDSEQAPASQAAKAAYEALVGGDTARLEADATSQGAAALAEIDPEVAKDLTFGGCGPGPRPKTRACAWSRPGGQLTMVLVRSGDSFKVDDASFGPAGLPPTSATTGATAPSS